MWKVVCLAVIAAGLLLAQIVKCAVDGQNCYFTGKTQVVSGVLMKEYRCPQGHLNWAR
jgi:hypothetical protein